MRSDEISVPGLKGAVVATTAGTIHVANPCASFVLPDPESPVKRTNLLVRRLARNLARTSSEIFRFAEARSLLRLSIRAANEFAGCSFMLILEVRIKLTSFVAK